MGIPVVAGDPIVMQTEAPFRYHALLIGIPNVDPAETNQQILDVIPRMETLLREHYGFETQMLLGYEATMGAIEQGLREYVEQLSDRDLLLLVYAGATESDDFLDESYWVTAPSEAVRSFGRDTRYWFSCNRVLKYINAMDARHILIVHEGAFAWNKQRGLLLAGKPEPDDWYASAMKQPSRMILCRPIPDTAQGLTLLPTVCALLEDNTSPFLASSDLVRRYRDATGDPLHEFGRLYDFKGTLKGEFVLEIRDHEGRSKRNGYAEAITHPSSGILEHAEARHMEAAQEVTQNHPESAAAGDPGSAKKQIDGMIPLIRVDLDPGQVFSTISGVGLQTPGVVATYDSIVGQAFRLENRAYVQMNSGELRSLGEGDFSIVFWFKSNRVKAFPLMNISASDRGIEISCNDQGVLSFTSAGPNRRAHWETIDSLETLVAEKWYYVVFSKKGNQLTASLNRKSQGSLEADYVTFPDNGEQLFLGRIGNTEGSPITFEGNIDEFEVYTHALSTEEMDSLYLRKYERFGLSPTLAVDSEDLDRIARMSFGSKARMADWRTLVTLFSGECEEFMDAIGLNHWETAFVACDGERIWKDNRHFLATRHSGNPRDYYLVHETLDSHQLDLGSWYQTRCKVLIQKY